MTVQTPDEAVDALRVQLFEIAKRGEITIDSLANRGQDRPLSMGVIGIFSTGKSTFLNALIKRPLLPTSMSPKTAVPMYITRTTGDELAERVPLKGAPTITKLEQAIADGVIPDEVDVDSSDFVSSIKLRQISLKLHLPDVFDAVELIDTPGLDSPYEEHELLARRVLRECDVVLYLLDEVVQDADKVALTIGQKSCSRFIFLQTKVDQQRPEGSWAETIEGNENDLEALLGQRAKIYPVSARKTLKCPDAAEPPEWGMPRVRELLGDALRDRRRLRTIADAKRLLCATEDAISSSESRTASLAGDEATLRETIEQIDRRRSRANTIGTQLDPLLAEARRTVSDFCGRRVAGWCEELRAAMLPVRSGDGVVERVRLAALRRARAIIDREAEHEVRSAVTLADGRALKILFETFDLDVAGPLRGHPEINVNPPLPERGFFNWLFGFFGAREKVSEEEIRRVAEETAASIRKELVGAVKASLDEAFTQYRSYVAQALPNMGAERAALTDQLVAGREERASRIADSAAIKGLLNDLRLEITRLLETLDAPGMGSASRQLGEGPKGAE